jgi:Xaa-Pro aminopeptidase
MPRSVRYSKTRLVIDSTRRSADLFYLTRLKAPDPIVWMQVGRRRILMLSELELDRARKEARADLFLPARTYMIRAARLFSRATPAHAAAVFLGDRGIRSVEVPASFPVSLMRVLEELGFDVAVSGEDFVPARRTKRQWEVREIRRCTRLGAEGIDLAVSMIHTAEARGRRLLLGGRPLTSEAVKREVTKYLVDRDCQAAGLIAAGRRDQTAMPHHTGSGALEPGEAIILDFFPKSSGSGYHGDITRTVVRGKAGEKLKKMYEAVRTVERKVAAMIRPGAEGRSLQAAALRMFERAGFKTGRSAGHACGFFHGIGHGLGLEIHEKPSMSGSDKLRPGDVVTVEPGLYYPETGGVRHENVYLVTRTGREPLTDYEIPFEI